MNRKGEEESQDALTSRKTVMYFFRSVVSIFQTFRNNLMFRMLIFLETLERKEYYKIYLKSENNSYILDRKFSQPSLQRCR